MPCGRAATRDDAPGLRTRAGIRPRGTWAVAVAAGGTPAAASPPEALATRPRPTINAAPEARPSRGRGRQARSIGMCPQLLLQARIDAASALERVTLLLSAEAALLDGLLLGIHNRDACLGSLVRA